MLEDILKQITNNHVTRAGNISQVALPNDPHDGMVFEAPEGAAIGGAVVLEIYSNGALIGSAQQLSPVQNVSRKYTITQVCTSEPVKKGYTLRVTGHQYLYNQATFIDGFGWVGTGVQEKKLELSNGVYKVIAALEIGPTDSNCRLYDQICLETITEEKNDEKPKHPART